MPITAIVIGATGLVGRSLVNQLAQAGQVSNIKTLTRRPADHPSSKVKNHIVDFDELEDSAPLFRGDLLFSCLGTTRKKAGSVEAQRKVDLQYQYKAAQLAADNGVKHYLLVSSSGAHANSRNAYLKMKGELEKKVQQLPFERISIFQPSLLLGQRSESRFGEKMASLIMPAMSLIPAIRRYRPISAHKVAAKMVQVSQKPGPSLEWFRLDEIGVKKLKC
jgi:uncharacterized protein YbjT (DUF2867 family)